MRPHILAAVDGLFEIEQKEALTAAADGWATMEWISLETPEPEYAAKAAAADIVIGMPDPAWIRRGRTKLLLLPAHGFDLYEGEGLGVKPGFSLCRAHGAIGVACAEHCIAMMFALARHIPEHVSDMRNRGWAHHEPYRVLSGTNACIVGMGSIGTEIARRLVGLEMRVSAVIRSEVQTPSGVHPVYRLSRLHQAVAEADHVISAVPGGPSTAALFDSAFFDAMKPGARFYNITRGSVLDEHALAERLRSGHLGGAGLDVFVDEPLPEESPLWGLDNVLITAHVAGYSPRRLPDLCDQFIANLTNFRDGKPLLNVAPL